MAVFDVAKSIAAVVWVRIAVITLFLCGIKDAIPALDATCPKKRESYSTVKTIVLGLYAEDTVRSAVFTSHPVKVLPCRTAK